MHLLGSLLLGGLFASPSPGIAEDATLVDPTELPGLSFFVDTSEGLGVTRCSSLDCFYAGENAKLEEQYCDTDVFPDGCVRRWTDRSPYRPNQGFEAPEWVRGRDFGQDDRDKPGIVADCLNGLPCVRGGRGALQERSLEIEPKQEVGPISGPFSIFLLARPIRQNDDFVYFGFAGTELIHSVTDDSLKLRIDFRRPIRITPQQAVSTDAWHLIEVHRDAAHRVRVLVDGWDQTLGAPSMPGNMFFRFLMSVSRGRAMHGDVAALAIFDRRLSVKERRQVRDYLASTYALSFGDGSPPPGVGAEIDLEHRLLLHWPLDQSCGEASTGPSWVAEPGCGKNGPQSVAGRVGNALDLTRANHGVRSVGPHPELDQLFRFSVAAWVRLDPEQPVQVEHWRAVVDKRDALDDGWDLYLTPQGQVFLRIDNLTLRGESRLEADRWHHVAGVYDGSHLRVYLDGHLDRSRFVDHKVSLGTGGPLYVGRKFDDRSAPLVGAVDEVRVYGRALTAPEILELARP